MGKNTKTAEASGDIAVKTIQIKKKENSKKKEKEEKHIKGVDDRKVDQQKNASRLVARSLNSRGAPITTRNGENKANPRSMHVGRQPDKTPGKDSCTPLANALNVIEESLQTSPDPKQH